MPKPIVQRYPLHLYHATLPPVIAHDVVEEKAARDKGYGDTYVHQKGE